MKHFELMIQDARSLLQNIKCDFAEIRLSSGETTSISLADGSVESITSGLSLAGSARVLKNGAWGFATFTGSGSIEGALKQALSFAAASASSLKTAVSLGIPAPAYSEIRRGINPADISIEEKLGLVTRYSRILNSSDKIRTTRAVYRDRAVNSAYLNSEGALLQKSRPYCGISLSSTAADGSLIQPFHSSVSGWGGFETVTGLEGEAERVASTAVDLLKAEPVPGGRYSVIADQRLAGVFIHEAFGHLSEADFIHERPDLRKIMAIGREFGPSFLNVYDDGTLEDLAGWIPFDDEGIPSSKTGLITNGMLSGRLHSRETAVKMGELPTGNARAVSALHQPLVRMTNTFIDNGAHRLDELMESAGDGIYAADCIGGQTNLEMFTFTSGYGFEVKNGKKGKMYRDIQLSGNVFSTLKSIRMAANDLKMFGGLGGCGKGGQSPLPVSFGGPHILIDDVLIGGTR